MPKPLILAVAALSLLALASCNVIYKPNIQQGNVLKAEHVEKLEPGMTKEQVLALLGQPMVTSPFTQNRWDYAYSLQHRGGDIMVKDYTVFFENGVVARTKGEYQAAKGEHMLKLVSQYPTILHNKEAEAKARRQRGEGR